MRPTDPAFRLLTVAQHNRLEQLRFEEAGIVVIGWSDRHNGPVLRYHGGRRRVVKPDGRIVKPAIGVLGRVL